MKGKNLTLGIILIAAGILWMLINMGFSTWFVWESLFKLWPLALVTIGIGLIFKGNRYVIALSWILLVALIIGYGLWEYRDLKVRPSGNPEIIIESRPQTNRGTLNINLNAGNLKFDSINDKLMRAYIPDPYVLHNVDFEGNRELQNVIEYAVNMTDEKGTITLDKLPASILTINKNENEYNLDKIEKDIIYKALTEFGRDLNSKKIVAEKLGIGIATLLFSYIIMIKK